MAKLVFVLLCLAFAVANVYCKDATLTPHSSGEAVVNAVMNKIHESCIFPNDKYFMIRIAAVNTDYGIKMTANNGGIWKVIPGMIAAARYYCPRQLRTMCNKALTTFNFDPNLITMKDMDTPLYSALVMRLSIAIYVSNIPASKSAQASWWMSLMAKSRPNEFMQKTVMSAGCFSSKMDLIFAIDASGSVGSRDFAKTLTFLKDVVKTLTIAPNLVRVGVIRYASSSTVSFQLDSYNDVNSVIQAIGAISYTSGGTNTASALTLAASTFKSDRPNVPKVLILITDGYSNSMSSTIRAATTVKGKKITIFTIGIGNARDLEMLAVASAPNCVHYYKLSSYGVIGSIIDQIQRKSCEVLRTVEGNTNDTDVGTTPLPPVNQTKTERIKFASNTKNTQNTNNTKNTKNGNTKNTRIIKVDVVCGVVHVYTSSSHKNPNSAVFDGKFVATDNLPAWIQSDVRYELYVSFISQRKADVNNKACSNPHYNISMNPQNTSVTAMCVEKGIARACTHFDIRKSFPELFDNTPQCGSVSNIQNNPCTNKNILAGKMRFPHPTNRKMYIQCKKTGGMEVVFCPTGFYNEQQSVCAPVAISANIGSTPNKGINPCTRATLLKKQFYFPNPSDTASFIQCDEHGGSFVVPCPNNLVWSEKAYTCVEQYLASHNPCNSSTGVYHYANPSNTSTFIQCDQNDIAAVMPCPPTLVWSVNSGCSHASNNQAKTSNNQAKTINNQAKTSNNQAKTINNQAKTINNQAKTINNQAKTSNNQAKTSKNQAQSCKDGDYSEVPGDKNSYYQCVHGKYTKMPCAANLEWSQAKKTCDYP